MNVVNSAVRRWLGVEVCTVVASFRVSTRHASKSRTCVGARLCRYTDTVVHQGLRRSQDCWRLPVATGIPEAFGYAKLRAVVELRFHSMKLPEILQVETSQV